MLISRRRVWSVSPAIRRCNKQQATYVPPPADDDEAGLLVKTMTSEAVEALSPRVASNNPPSEEL